MKENQGLRAEFNIYDWILSKEIREDWKKKPPLPPGEQAQIIFTAYRPIEDKLQALMEILEKAGECEEREELEQAVCYYKVAMERMKPGDKAFTGERGESPKDIWTVETYEYENRMGSLEGKHDLTAFYLFYSFEAAKQWIGSLKYEDESVEHCVCKWILGKEKPKDVLECTLRMVGGQLCTIDVYMDDYRRMTFSHDRHLPYGIPFSIGDLVKLDGPVFSEPLFGVWCGEYGFDGCWYNYMGYMESWERDKMPVYGVRNMGYHQVDGVGPLSVLDWLSSASGEELPGEQRKLGEISEKISGIREQRGEVEAAKRFREVFGM